MQQEEERRNLGKNKKRAILLMAYGSPDKVVDIEPYYTHIRHGRKPAREELENLKERYAAIGGHSPLFELTQSTAIKLETHLNSKLSGPRIRVYVGMKHWHPYIAEEFEKIVSEGTTDLLSIALAPHYSKMSIGSYQDAVRQASMDHGSKIALQFVDQWHLDPVFIKKWVERVRIATNKHFLENVGNNRKKEFPFYLFTAHSLPERISTWNDPYKNQLLETASEIAKNMRLDKSQFDFAFQSAGHTSEPWLGPDILDKLKELAKDGRKNVLVVPIGFVSDHLEILFDIDKEAKLLGEELGVKVERTESFNDSDDFIEVLYSVVARSGFLSEA